MSDFLFSLPTWAVVLIVLASCALAFLAWCICAMGGLSDDRIAQARERRIERVEQRMIALNHRDVAERSDRRDFESWDADEDLATVLPFERKTPAEVIPLATRAMDSDGIGAA